MRVLLDECINPRVKAAFRNHQVWTVAEKRWKGLKNGDLLALAEQEFDVFVTIDQSIEYQQNIRKLRLGIVVVRVGDNDITSYLPIFAELDQTAGRIRAGEVLQVVSPGLSNRANERES